MSHLQIWKKFFTFEHPILEVPEIMPTNFGEPHFPPLRQGTGTSKKTRKAKCKQRQLKKKQAAMAARAARKNKDGMNEEKEEDKDGEGQQKQTEAEERLDGSGVEKVVDDSENNRGDTVETQDDKLIIEEETAKKVEAEDTDQSQAKKPRIRETEWDPLMPSFRVTCVRHGDKHNFDSMTAAANFGGAVYTYFKWNVKMTEFDIEVILGIENHELSVSIGLTKESLHRRNITHFGPTTLRPTIAHNMLR